MSGQEWMLIVLFLALFGGILSGIPAMLAISGVPLVLAVIAGQFDLFNLAFLSNFPARVLGVMTNTLLMAVPLFVLMGVFLERAQLAERMLRVLARLLGGSPLGMGLAVLAFSAIIAASTGIIGATVVMLVLIALTPMLEAGVPKRQAAGLICASGTLGQIIPPSILLVLLGDQIGNTYLEAQQRAGNFAPMPVSVADLFAGAMVPGLVLVGLYALWLLITLRPGRMRRVSAEREPVAMSEVLFTFLPPMLLILAVLGSILGGIATATEAAGLGAVGAGLMAAFSLSRSRLERSIIGIAGLAAFVLVAIRMSLGRGDAGSLAQLVSIAAALLLALGVLVAIWRLVRGDMLGGTMLETIKISGMVFGIVIAASMLSLVFRGFGGEHAVEHLMREFPGGEMGALLAVMVIVFLLGFILEAVEIIYIVVPLLGPAVLAGDISPVWFAVLMAMNLQTSFLTPPFGFALFYFRSVAPRGISTMDIYRGVVPFVLIQILAVVLVFAFPALATWLPTLMFN
ncbi:TRAP transporter large permease [Pararhodobacter marinus]|uniref:TRAP transporter large permease n=2 Tax=Pararhodobacter marinus TaxID=2184063 RepID=UPI00351619AE